MKTHKLRQIISLMLAVIMMINVLPVSSMGAGWQQETVTAGGNTYYVTSTDTSGKLVLSDVTITNDNGYPFASTDTLSDGDTIKLNFSFKINDNAMNINHTMFGNTYVTVYREELDMQNLTVTNSDWAEFDDATIDGYWRIVTENGKTYFDVIVTSHTHLNDVSGKIKMEGTVSATDLSNEDMTNGTVTLKFEDATEKVSYNNTGALYVTKDKDGDVVYDSTSNTYTQKWKVTLKSSSTGYVILKSFEDTSNVASTLSGDITINYPNGSTTTVSDFDAVISGGELLSGGEAITITYTTIFDADDVSSWLAAGQWNTVRNTATVEYNDKSASDYEDLSLSSDKPSVSKSGSYDSSTGTITYTIKLYSDNFSGDRATDSANVTDIKDTVTMSATGYSESLSIPNLIDSGWTWVAKVNSWDEASHWVYTYKYTLTDQQLVYESNYTNVFEATIGGEDVKDDDTQYNIYNNYVSKSGAKVDGENTILWTVTFTVPYDNFDLSGLKINDSWSSGMSFAGSVAATLTTQSGTSTINVSTADGSVFSFSDNYQVILSKDDVVTLTYKTSIPDPSLSTSTIYYSNTATPKFVVPDFPTVEPTQYAYTGTDVNSTSTSILKKSGYLYGSDAWFDYSIDINTSNITSTQTITVIDRLSIPETYDTDTNYLYAAWQKYIATYGEDYSGAFTLENVFVGGTYTTDYSISSDGVITFVITDVPTGTSNITISYDIGFTFKFKNIICDLYEEAINAGVGNPCYFMTNTATAYVDDEERNTDDATSKTDHDFVPSTYIEKSGTYKGKDDVGSISGYDYVSVQGDTIVYTLTINQDGETMNDGNPLTVTDELGSGLALWSASAVENGTQISSYTYVSGYDANNLYNRYSTTINNPSNVMVLKADNIIIDAYNSFYCYELLERGSDYTVSYDYDTHVITFTIPDSTPVTIIYYCEILFDNGAYTSGELDNTVTISGSDSVAIDSSEKSYTVSYKLTSEITGRQVTLSIDKLDSISLAPIYGATFTVTPVNEDGTARSSSYQQLTVDKGNNTVIINYDVIYEIKETGTPDGYTSDQDIHYVYLQSASALAIDNINGIPITVFKGGTTDITVTPKVKIKAAEGAVLTITTTDGSLSAENFESDYNIIVTVNSSNEATVTYAGSFAGQKGDPYWWVNVVGLTAGTYYVTSGTDEATLTVDSSGTVIATTNTSGNYIKEDVTPTNYYSASVQITNTPSVTLTINKYATGGSTQLPGAEFTLKANTSLESVTANQAFTLSSDNYSLSFTTTDTAIEFYGLPDGSYTLTETVAPGGYKVADPVTFTVADGKIDGSSAKTITVEDDVDATQPQTTSVTVTKSWVDDNDRDGIRPDSVTVTLTGSDGNTYTAKLSATDGWTYTWTDLPKENGGVDIIYTVDEDTVPTGYNKSVNGYEITNTHTIETTSVTVTKKWEDDSNRDKLRPTEVTVSLLADGTIVDTVSVTEANGWEYTWDNLPKNDNGVEIVYTVAEVDANGVSTAPNGYTASDPVGNAATGFTITNTHEIYRTEVKVTKAWIGDDNNLSARPSEITVVLTKNGSDSTQTITLNAGNNWTDSFKNLPVNDENGDPIAYGVKEVTVNSYRSDITGDADNGFTITNTYKTSTLTVSKVYTDSEGTALTTGLDSYEATFTLVSTGDTDTYSETFTITGSDAETFSDLAYNGTYKLTETNGPSGFTADATEIEITIVDGVVSGYSNNTVTVTNKADKTAAQTATLTVSKSYADADGNTLSGTDIDSLVAEFTLTPANGTAGSAQTVKITGANTGEFTGLEYNGTYTLSETDVPDGYTAAADVTITIVNGEVSGYSNNTVAVTNVAKTSVTVYKVWDDGENRDNTRTSITIKLLAGGTQVDSIILTDANKTTDNTWSYTFTNLDVYDTNGNKIVYTVEEDGVSSIYTSSGEGNSSNNYTITNSYSFKTTEVKVTKAWVSDDNNLSARPSEITVVLTKNGSDSTQTITLNSGNNWTGSFKSLPVNDENGDPIAYGVKEVTVNSYRSDITGDADNGFTITNTYEPPMVTISVSGTKTWVDGGLTHDNATEITLTLYRTTADNPTDSDWDKVSATVSWSGNTYTYSNLDKYDLSTGKTYSYKVEESAVADYTSTPEQTSTGYDFTNTIKQVTISVSGTKTWVDPTDTTHPDITIELYQDGTKIDDVTLPNGTTTYEFTGLDKYDLTDGHAYEYTVKEAAVSGYTSEQNGNDFTNTIAQVTISVSGTKTWVDPTGTTHPDITIELYRDGTKIDDVTLSDGTTTYEFTGLDKYDLTDGHAYEYTVEETAVSGYTSEQNGYDFTNTIAQDTISVSGTKTWVDPTGTTHPDITIELYRDGTKIDDVTLSNGTTTYEFTGLDKYDLTDGHAYEYTVKEAAVSGYTSESKQTSTGYDFTNTIKQVTISVSGTKTWIDPAGTTHPDITIELYRDGSKIDDVTLSNGTTTYEFTGLDKYDLTDGHAYEYTVKEAKVSGYTSKQNGNDFTNTIAQVTISVSGTKTWVDPTGTTHPDITIELYRDGTYLTSKTISDGTTTYEFTGLDKYDLTDGHAYEYTVKEAAVSGYTSESKQTSTGYDFTNTIKQVTISVSGTKTWIDPAGTTHPDITIELYRDGSKIDDVTLSNGTTTYEFDGLDKYDLTDGHAYVYTLKEATVSGYTSKQEDNNFTNTIEQDTVDVTGTKTWIDPTGTTHPDITIELYRDGTKIDDVTLPNGTTTYEFTGLDKYDLTDGHAYEYTVKEVAVSGYTSEQSDNDFTNIQITTEVTVNKVWDDAENQDGLREDYSVTLYKTVNGVETKVDSQTLPANTLTYTWTELPTYETVNGTQYEISYTVKETGVPSGYTASDPDGDAATGFEITNSHTPYTTEVSVTKVWSDAGDYDGVRPDSITVTLTGSDGKTYTAELTKDSNWEYTFTDLPVYWNEGTEIEYTLEEVKVEGYATVITGDAENGFTVTNSHTPHAEPSQVYTGIEVTKVWNDDNNADGVRPASVTVALYRDGVVTGRTITLSEANNWTASFTHLPVYNGTAAYSYTVAELNVPAEYTATVTGGNGSFTITNTYMPVVEIEEPVEATNTDEEEDGEAPEAPETESNPKTGIALSVLPMAMAALAVASVKRR